MQVAIGVRRCSKVGGGGGGNIWFSFKKLSILCKFSCVNK